jgi:hypothetical protein
MVNGQLVVPVLFTETLLLSLLFNADCLNLGGGKGGKDERSQNRLVMTFTLYMNIQRDCNCTLYDIRLIV